MGFEAAFDDAEFFGLPKDNAKTREERILWINRKDMIKILLTINLFFI